MSILIFALVIVKHTSFLDLKDSSKIILLNSEQKPFSNFKHVSLSSIFFYKTSKKLSQKKIKSLSNQ